MKRLFTFTLLLIILTSLCSCTFPNTQQSRITFYYIKTPDDFDGSSDIIVPFHPSSDDDNRDLSEILDAYLSGPSNNSCTSPFPQGTTIEEIVLSRSNAQLTLNRQFATLSDIDFTIACACLTKTVIDLTGVNTVQVQVNGSQILGADSLTFNLSSFSHSDETPADPHD